MLKSPQPSQNRAILGGLKAQIGRIWGNMGKYGEKGSFGQNKLKCLRNLKMGGFKRHLDVEFGFFDRN